MNTIVKKMTDNIYLKHKNLMADAVRLKKDLKDDSAPILFFLINGGVFFIRAWALKFIPPKLL